jgi:hypothetical protein
MRIFAVVLAFSSFNALACPNLAGQYARCVSSTGVSAESTDVVVTQSIQNKVTTYTFTSTDSDTQERHQNTFIADGRTYSTSERDPESGWVMETKLSLRCVGQSLHFRSFAILDGEEIAHTNQIFTKQGKQIQSKMEGRIMGQAISDLICE